MSTFSTVLLVRDVLFATPSTLQPPAGFHIQTGRQAASISEIILDKLKRSQRLTFFSIKDAGDAHHRKLVTLEIGRLGEARVHDWIGLCLRKWFSQRSRKTILVTAQTKEIVPTWAFRRKMLAT
jgi:hypothetical protein